MIPYRPEKYEGKGGKGVGAAISCSLEYHYHDPAYTRMFNPAYVISNEFSTVVHALLETNMM